MISSSKPDEIRWELVPDTSAELFDDLRNARSALAKNKLMKAGRIATRILDRLPSMEQLVSSPPTLSLRASAHAIFGIAAHRQGGTDADSTHLTAAISIFRSLLDKGYELDAASRGEYAWALLLTEQAGSALEFAGKVLDAGGKLPPDLVLHLTKVQRDLNGPSSAILFLRLAHNQQPEDFAIADALARALGDEDQQEAAAKVYIEAAVLLARRGDYAQSEEYFRRSLAAHPGLPSAVAGLAQVLMAQGKSEEAIQTAQLGTNQHPSTPELVAIHADALAKAGDSEGAIEAAREGLDRFDGSPLLASTYVRFLTDAGRLAEAMPWVESVLDKDPDNPDMLRAKAEILLSEGNPAEAITILRQLVDEFPESTDHRVSLVRALMAVEDEEDAYEILKAGLSMSPDDPGLLSERATLAESWVQYAQEHITEADPAIRIALERVLALNDENAWAHALLGEILRRQNAFAEALVHLDRALTHLPRSGWVVGTRGQVLNALGRPEAIAELRRAAELDDSLSWVHTELGDIYRVTGRYYEALNELSQATEKAPSDAWAWASRGATEALLGHWEDARSSLDTSIRLVPHYPWALAVKADVLDSIDESEDALQTVRASLEADGQVAWVWGLKAWLLNKLDMDPEEEEQAARAALDLTPDDVYLLIRLAEALLRQQRDDEADAAFQRAVDSITTSSEGGTDLFHHLAWCHLRLRHYNQALSYLSALLTQDSAQISAAFDLGLTLLCAGRADVALDQYEDAAELTRMEAHAGHRRNLAHIARHDLRGMLDRGQIQRGAEVEQVEQLLGQVASLDPQ